MLPKLCQVILSMSIGHKLWIFNFVFVISVWQFKFFRSNSPKSEERSNE